MTKSAHCATMYVYICIYGFADEADGQYNNNNKPPKISSTWLIN